MERHIGQKLRTAGGAEPQPFQIQGLLFTSDKGQGSIELPQQMVDYGGAQPVTWPAAPTVR